jgi:hypothetical protein
MVSNSYREHPLPLPQLLFPNPVETNNHLVHAKVPQKRKKGLKPLVVSAGGVRNKK